MKSTMEAEDNLAETAATCDLSLVTATCVLATTAFRCLYTHTVCDDDVYKTQ